MLSNITYEVLFSAFNAINYVAYGLRATKRTTRNRSCCQIYERSKQYDKASLLLMTRTVSVAKDVWIFFLIKSISIFSFIFFAFESTPQSSRGNYFLMAKCTMIDLCKHQSLIVVQAFCYGVLVLSYCLPVYYEPRHSERAGSRKCSDHPAHPHTSGIWKARSTCLLYHHLQMYILT